MISGGTVEVVMYAFEKNNLYCSIDTMFFFTDVSSIYAETLFAPPFFPLTPYIRIEPSKGSS